MTLRPDAAIIDTLWGYKLHGLVLFSKQQHIRGTLLKLWPREIAGIRGILSDVIANGQSHRPPRGIFGEAEPQSFHRIAHIPLETGRRAAILRVSAEDQRQLGAVIGAEPRHRRDIREVTGVLIPVRWEISSIAILHFGCDGTADDFCRLVQCCLARSIGCEGDETGSFIRIAAYDQWLQSWLDLMFLFLVVLERTNSQFWRSFLPLLSGSNWQMQSYCQRRV